MERGRVATVYLGHGGVLERSILGESEKKGACSTKDAMRRLVAIVSVSDDRETAFESWKKLSTGTLRRLVRVAGADVHDSTR